MTMVVREATFEDRAAVDVLMAAAGWPSRSEAGWHWLFKDNPALRDDTLAAPIGWVIEEDDKLHGYLANIHLDYAKDGKDLRAATCANYYVSEEARAMSLKLMTQYFRQKGVDFFLSTTANEHSAPIYKLFKAATPQGEGYTNGYVWVADERRAISDALGRYAPILGANDWLAMAAAPALRAGQRLFGYARSPANAFDGEVIELQRGDVGPQFDAFWQELRVGNRLMTRRDAAAIKWHMSNPDVAHAPSLFAAIDAKGLAGFALGARHKPGSAEIARYKLLDLVVRDNADGAVPALLDRICKQARIENAGIVQATRIGDDLDQKLSAVSPIRFRFKASSHYVRATNAKLTEGIIQPGGWGATGLDGDQPFCVFDRAA